MDLVEDYQIIERLNKGFMCLTNVMEIVAGHDRLLSNPGLHILEN